MKLEVTFKGASLTDVADKVEGLGRATLEKSVKEMNAQGAVLRTGLVGVLSQQTGLKKSTLSRALKESKAEVAHPVYQIRATGGNISLKYFNARETARGVSAAPWGLRRIFKGTFLKAGWWPHRLFKPGWHGQVFQRTGGITKHGISQFMKVRSGLFIAEEMVSGESLTFFDLQAKLLRMNIENRLTDDIL